MKILLVEDDADSGEALMVLLSDIGHEVRWASNAPRAVALATQFEPELAILDIGLPVLSGYDLIALLKAVPALATCRYIALSAYAGNDLSERSHTAGFEEHLTKPLNWPQLLAHLPP